MTAKELIEKLDPNTKANLWDIIIDGEEYLEDDKENISEHLNSEVKKWSLEYSIQERFFYLTLRVYTVDYEPYFFEETEEYDGQ